MPRLLYHAHRGPSEFAPLGGKLGAWLYLFRYRKLPCHAYCTTHIVGHRSLTPLGGKLGAWLYLFRYRKLPCHAYCTTHIVDLRSLTPLGGKLGAWLYLFRYRKLPCHAYCTTRIVGLRSLTPLGGKLGRGSYLFRYRKLPCHAYCTTVPLISKGVDQDFSFNFHLPVYPEEAPMPLLLPFLPSSSSRGSLLFLSAFLGSQ